MFRQEALERLSTPERLDELMHVTSPRSWIALIALGGLIAAALIWSGFTTISTTVAGAGVLTGSSSGSSRVAIVYVKPSDGITIRPGMDVTLTQLAPQSGRSATLDGKVASIEPLPASQSSMLQTLGSPGLVQLLAAAGQVTPVHVRFAAAGGAGSTAAKGGQTQATPGGQISPVQATITTNRERIIRMIIP